MTSRAAAALAAALLAAGCSDAHLLPPAVAVPGGAPTASVQVIGGQTGPGALYEMHVPAEWNGELVLYAHGFRDPALPVAIADQDSSFALRDRLVARGYAVAYSSYSENGFAVQDAALRTHQLRGLFAARVGVPGRTYLAGHSLGAVAALRIVEQHPEQYAGVLAMCGQVGGLQATVDYFAHVRVLFDYFYPGVLPGDALNVPAGVDLNTQVIGPALGAIQANPAGAGAIARIMAAQGMPVPAASGPQLVESILRALAYDFRALPDLLRRTHGHSPFDNTATVYSSPALPGALLADLNARVDRFASTPDAREYLSRNYTPTGAIGLPVLTLFNTLDPVSPPFHEPAYRSAAAAAGAGHLLHQRRVDRYGHCAFSVGEMDAAFGALAEWVQAGAAPTD